MEEHTTRGDRVPRFLRSGPIRLTAMIALTAVALLAPVISQIRATQAEAAVERIAVPEEPATGPVTSATTTPTPSPSPTVAPALPPLAVVATDEAVGKDATASIEDGTSVCLPDPTALTQAETDSAETDSAEADTAGAVYLDGFDAQRTEWQILAGDWTVADGILAQRNAEGFDLLAELAVAVPDAVSISVALTADGGDLGGGIMVGQPTPMTRNGATIVDFTDGGRFLRWGTYDADTGVYEYLGGVAMDTEFDPAATHVLTVELQPGRTSVSVDGLVVGAFGAVPDGRVGLVTSASSVVFDDFEIRAIAESNDAA